MSPRLNTLVVGVVGGIGSGKSEISRGLSQYFQILLIDADRIGHEVLGLSVVQTGLRQAFGDGVFDGNEICRKSLAREVFGLEPSHKQSRTTLEKIVHPQIRKLVQQQLDDIDDKIEVVILDAAVMFEAGWDDLCDTIVFVDTPFDVRLARVEENRGWTRDELKRRESSQISIDEKRSAAEFTVDNSRALEDAVKQLSSIVQTKLSDIRNTSNDG